MELKTTWLGLSPPVVESSMGKWYAGIYKMKKDKKWKIRSNRNVMSETQRGNRDDLEDTPDHLPDIEIFKVYDVVPVSLEVISVKRKN